MVLFMIHILLMQNDIIIKNNLWYHEQNSRKHLFMVLEIVSYDSLFMKVS